ncbi:LysR substrate-binding domain-containing protein [uncultured Tateyamaria sp.]|uniref:LysR substrate-binding domain-containing protein n=1 Tax=uncultured Tateyamaria sp. TaxID=455651 RepID=UPI002628FADD|nr:LysR substrate-binding domain-containing protein [uncultured Tateyamaria sp.]
MHNLPSLNMLLVFVEAARVQSFSVAAERLGVTQSAVSKQVSALEAQMGQPLFTRHHRRVELTEYGAEVAQAAAPAFEHLSNRLNAIGSVQTRQIRFVGDADFVQLWLFPKLPAFERAHPKIRVSIHTQVEMSKAPDMDYDCGIIWGRGNWQNCQYEPFLTNRVFPVAKPGFFDHLNRVPRLDDIDDSQLIHDQTRFWWTALRNAVGLPGFDADSGRIYNQSYLCLEAAARGEGVTIGDEVTTRDYLQSGRLVRPFATALPAHDSYFLVRPRHSRISEPTEAFLRWLRQEADAHESWFRRSKDANCEVLSNASQS